MTKLPLTIAISALLLSTACTSTVQQNNTSPMAELTFAHMQMVPINVSKINYDSYVRLGATTWDVADDLPTPPDVAMQRYLKKRFRAIGSDGILNVNLQQAQITSTEVPNENKILSYVPLANVEEYKFEITVDLESTYLAGQPNAKNTMRFVRKSRIPVDATIVYREARLQRTLEELMVDIDEALLNVLSGQFQLVAERNLPKSNLPVKTQIPNIKTNTGVQWNEFKDGVNDMSNRVGDTFKEGNEPVAAPQKLEPVQSEPLN
jgi:hypothetical protein